MKILIVEDDPIGLISLSAALKALGHEVVQATNGAEAVALVRREKIRVVVSDWKMPVLDGLSLCQTLRRDPTDYVYFILLSAAEATNENYAAALQGGHRDTATLAPPGTATLKRAGRGSGRRASSRGWAATGCIRCRPA